MEGYGPPTWGDNIASEYDSMFGYMFDVEATVEFLLDEAGPGPLLELGVGTGRIALPLAERGVEVHGIDASQAMLDRLRAKPGGAEITTTVADFGEAPMDGPYGLIFVAFNTFFALTSQDDQVRCFANIASALHEEGCFVIEAFVPDPTRWSKHQRVGVDSVKSDSVTLEVSRHDPVSQRVEGQQVVVSQSGIRLYPVFLRYAWPSELDLMARLAGLRLRERWGSWARDPFTSDSTSHVSVYEPT
jgi:SAM-dependent methyltransferase